MAKVVELVDEILQAKGREKGGKRWARKRVS